jgi:hypothetical protein
MLETKSFKDRSSEPIFVSEGSSDKIYVRPTCGFKGHSIVYDATQQFDFGSILELGNLEAGWDYGEGEPIDRKVINNAIMIAGISTKLGHDYEAQPISDGGIKLILSHDDVFLDINIEHDLSINITKEKGFGYNYESLCSKDHLTIEQLIIEIISLSTNLGAQCSLYEPFILENTAVQKVGSLNVLGTITEQFRSSISPALTAFRGAKPASIFHYITTIPLETPKHSG